MKALLIKVGFCDVLVWSLDKTNYAKLQLWRTFNLNKTQSLNDALRVVYMEEDGGISWPLGKGSETNPISCFPTHTDSKKQPILKYFENTWVWPNNKVTQHLE